jgi:hypothetical protein
MAIEIVDLPIEHGDFQYQYCSWTVDPPKCGPNVRTERADRTCGWMFVGIPIEQEHPQYIRQYNPLN